MSKITVVTSLTYAVELDIPLGFLVAPKKLAAEQTKQIKQATRDSLGRGQKLLDVQATTVVVPSTPW